MKIRQGLVLKSSLIIHNRLPTVTGMCGQTQTIDTLSFWGEGVVMKDQVEDVARKEVTPGQRGGSMTPSVTGHHLRLLSLQRPPEETCWRVLVESQIK